MIPTPALPPTHPVSFAKSPLLTEFENNKISLEKFWETTSENQNPFIEPAETQDQRVVTFLWRDQQNSEIKLVGRKTFENEFAFHLLPKTDIWYLTLLLDSDWRASYQLRVDGELRPDPRARAFSPETQTLERSVAELPDAPRQPWLQRRESTVAGTVKKHQFHSTFLADNRPLWSYRPDGYHPDKHPPLLIMLDGDSWLSERDLTETLDNLIAAQRIPPMAAIFLASPEGDQREQEFACNSLFAQALADELIPWAEQEFQRAFQAEHTILAGQSFSGLAATHAALMAPHRFGNVLSQSASYWFGGMDGTEPEFLIKQFEAQPRKPIRFYLEAGYYEELIFHYTERFHRTLYAKGYSVDYVRFNGGHDPACWHGGFADGLISLTKGWNKS